MPINTYQPVLNSRNGELQKVMLEQHWQEARGFNQQINWVTGIFLSASGYVLYNNNECTRVLFLFLGLAGLVAFLVITKLQYLYEIHINKAQIYAAGNPRGRIFSFNIGNTQNGEEKGPSLNCPPLYVFFKVSKITVLYSSVIILLSLYWFAKVIFATEQIRNLNTHPAKLITVTIIASIVTYLLVKELISALQNRARNMSLLNVSAGWHNLLDAPARQP